MVRLKKYAYNINFYAQSPLQSLNNDTIIDTSNEKKIRMKCNGTF